MIYDKLLKRKKLVMHKGTSHRFYVVKMAKYSTKYIVFVEWGRIGGYETTRQASVKGYKKTLAIGGSTNKLNALVKFFKAVESKKLRGYV